MTRYNGLQKAFQSTIIGHRVRFYFFVQQSALLPMHYQLIQFVGKRVRY